MDKQQEKQAVVLEYLSGGTSTRKLGTKYGYGYVTISRWIMAHKKQEQQQIPETPAELSDKDIPNAIKELQEALRISRLKVDLLESMIDISDEQFGTVIRKKTGTRRS